MRNFTDYPIFVYETDTIPNRDFVAFFFDSVLRRYLKSPTTNVTLWYGWNGEGYNYIELDAIHEYSGISEKVLLMNYLNNRVVNLMLTKGVPEPWFYSPLNTYMIPILFDEPVFYISARELPGKQYTELIINCYFDVKNWTPQFPSSVDYMYDLEIEQIDKDFKDNFEQFKDLVYCMSSANAVRNGSFENIRKKVYTDNFLQILAAGLQKVSIPIDDLFNAFYSRELVKKLHPNADISNFVENSATPKNVYLDWWHINQLIKLDKELVEGRKSNSGQKSSYNIFQQYILVVAKQYLLDQGCSVLKTLHN